MDIFQFIPLFHFEFKIKFEFQELIPEFYYLSDMFVNTNSCCLGTNEGGVSINNVVLPPWAKSPEDFVRIMRMVGDTSHCLIVLLVSLFFV